MQRRYTIRRIIPDGDAGTIDTLNRMRDLVLRRVAHARIRTAAETVVLAGCRAGAYCGGTLLASAIRAYLTRVVRFSEDPDGEEVLVDPIVALDEIGRDGWVALDCDDVAVLGAVLGMAGGSPARFVVVGFDTPDAPYAHVWAEIHDGVQWCELDTTRRYQGRGPDPRICRRLVVDVRTGQMQHEYPRGRLMVQRTVYAAPRGQLGVGPLVITGALELAQRLAPLSRGTGEATRIARIDAAYQLALAGSPAALLYLKHLTGEYGTTTIPGYGTVGGAASPSGKAYAKQKYEAALNALAADRGGTGIVVDTPVARGSVSNAGMIAVAVVAAIVLLGRRRA